MSHNYLVAGNSLTGGLSGDGYGLESVVGLLWEPHSRLSLGATARSGADVILHGDAHAEMSAFGLAETSRFRYPVHHPPTLDTGLAWRASERCTLSFDVHQTYWHGFFNASSYDTPGALLVNTANTFTWRDTWKLRFGASWQVAEKTTLLAGYSYDRFAVDSGSIDFATAIDVPMHRFSAGLARRWSKRVETVLGCIGGFGNRSEGNVQYGLSGIQLMAETRLTF